jgi:hypothetical protein
MFDNGPGSLGVVAVYARAVAVPAPEIVATSRNGARDPLARDKKLEEFRSYQCIGDAGHGVGLLLRQSYLREP